MKGLTTLKPQRPKAASVMHLTDIMKMQLLVWFVSLVLRLTCISPVQAEDAKITFGLSLRPCFCFDGTHTRDQRTPGWARPESHSQPDKHLFSAGRRTNIRRVGATVMSLKGQRRASALNPEGHGEVQRSRHPAAPAPTSAWRVTICQYNSCHQLHYNITQYRISCYVMLCRYSCTLSCYVLLVL